MRFRLLGSMEVRGAEGWARVDRPRRRALLGYLLLAGDRTVPARELSAALWGPAPPATARTQLHNDVAALRKLLAADFIQTRTGGYALSAAGGDIDERVFQARLARGTAAAARGGWPAAVRPLRDALALWRGPALADVAAPYAGPARDRLDRQRVDAVELLAEARIRLGGHDEQIPVLHELLEDHPSRDRAAALLMLALVRAGRRAEALGVVRELRRHLRDGHGLDPAWLVTSLESRILRDDPALLTGGLPAVGAPPAAPPPPAPVPINQLPMDVRLLAGRDAELATLGAFAADPDGARIALVTGTAGVGKTALAVRFGHGHADAFPDGVLFVDLRGYDPAEPPLPPLAALHRMLAGMGVPTSTLPPDVDDATALFRSRTAAGRYLLVLDNAGSAAQVRALLPGGSGCFVVVTSRDSLAGLLASHAVVRVPLPVLTVPAGLSVLTRVLGSSRVDAEPAAALELVELCGGLPLAIRIVAANLADSPSQPLRSQTELLRAQRLSALDNPGDMAFGVRSVLRSTYAALPASARRAFRLLSALPFGNLAVAALAGFATPADIARLRAVHLVEEPAPGRIALHDLPRAFGVELAAERDDPTDRATAAAGVLDWLAHRLETVSSVLYPDAVRLVAGAVGPPPVTSDPGAGGPRAAGPGVIGPAGLDGAGVTGPGGGGPRIAEVNLGVPGATAPGMAGPGASALAAGGPDAALRPEPGEARGWIAAERANLLRAVGFAREAGLDATAWRLAALLRGHLVGNAAWLDLAEVSATGLAAATAGGSVPGAALHHLGVADARRRLGDQEGAIAGYAEAARLAREAGWLECQAVASGHLGLVHFRVGDLDRAFDCFQQDFTLSGEVGWRGAQSVALGNMGNCMRSLGRPGDALDYYERCAAIARETGAERVVAIATFNAGVCARELGDAATARAYVKQAIRLNREFGRLDLCLEGYAELGLVAAEESDVEDARRWHRLAGKLADRIGKAAIDPVIMAEVEVTEAALRIAEDRAEEALPVLASAQHRSREADLAYTRTDVAVWQGRALARLGRHDEARERFESAIAEARSRGFGRLERLAAGGLSTLADHPETIRK